jgi:prepilin-type N-terminal cleavage/methylation domain-containing protein
MKNNFGFTLLELIIAIGIFAVMSGFVAMSIKNGIQAKSKIQTQIDETSRMRDSLKLMERDLNQAYHHLDWEKEFQDKVKNPNQAQTPPLQPGQVPPPTPPTPPPAPTEVQRQDPTTHFVGSQDKMNFVTMNNARFQTDKKMADFVEVGYELRSCNSADGKTSSSCLWRRQSSAVDLDVTKGGDSLVLLENVTELKFRYLGQNKEDWVSDWNSTDQSSDGGTKGQYPLAVEISITTQKGEKGRKNSMQIVANIHNPNNPAKTNNSGTPGVGSPTGGGDDLGGL